MRDALRRKAIAVCDEKIAKKGSDVGLSFHAFFANKNDDPPLLIEAAAWWIMTHQLNHFEKAAKIRTMLRTGLKEKGLTRDAPSGQLPRQADCRVRPMWPGPFRRPSADQAARHRAQGARAGQGG